MKEKLKALLRTRHEPPIAAVIRPFQKFFKLEEAGGILLIACTIVALVWANSPWAASYAALWGQELGFGIGSFELKKSLLHWINDGLMALFFFFVGLEIKREILIGELSSLRKAALPIAAAVGGMIVPALIYSAMNVGGTGARGWGIPMATDIAFALGILGLLGKRIPLGLTVFLAALAIADDVGAVVVIAVFYVAQMAWMPLVVAGGVVVLLMLANRLGVRNAFIYLLLGIVVWLCVLQSGVHASIAGVIVAMTIPARKRAGQIETPLGRMEHALYPWVSFVIIPLFALANAGIVVGAGVSEALQSPVTLGVILGLALGKPIGITLFAWMVVKLRVASLPDAVSWRHLHGAAWLGGIGFTMSIFITTLAFTDGILVLEAKVGVLVASVVSGVIGWLILRSTNIATPSTVPTPTTTIATDTR